MWGATGGVGVFAVQIAKYLGATVIGVGGPEWKLQKLRVRWVLSTIPYALVHVTSGLLILPLSAWFAGFVLGFTARTHGLPASITAHVLWLYLVLYLLPTYKVL